MPTVAEQLTRAFSSFEPIAKRSAAPTVGAVEIDLAKVAAEIARDGATLGVGGDVAELEKRANEIDAFLAKVHHDATTDLIVAPADEIAKRFAADDLEKQYNVDQGSGKAVPPTGAAADKLRYTGKPANQASDADQYTGTSNESVGKAPNGKTGTTFDQASGGPNVGKAGKVAKGAAPASPSKPQDVGNAEALLTQNDTQPQDGAVSEGFALRGKGKPAAKVAKAASTDEVRWSRDMAAEREDEITKAARKAAGEDDEDDSNGDLEPTDDRSAPDAKAKRKAAAKIAAKKKAEMEKAQYDGPEQTVDDVDENRDAQAAAAIKPNSSNTPEDGPPEEVDEVSAGKGKRGATGKADARPDASQEGDETDDEDEDEDDEKAKKAKAAKGAFPGAAKPFGSKGKGEKDDDSEDDDEDDSDEKPAKKSAVAKGADSDGTVWERDMAPAISPTRRAERLTAAEVPIAARPGMRATADRIAGIRKAALEGVVATSSDVRAQMAAHRARVAKRQQLIDDPSRGGVVLEAKVEVDSEA